MLSQRLQTLLYTVVSNLIYQIIFPKAMTLVVHAPKKPARTSAFVQRVRSDMRPAAKFPTERVTPALADSVNNFDKHVPGKGLDGKSSSDTNATRRVIASKTGQRVTAESSAAADQALPLPRAPTSAAPNPVKHRKLDLQQNQLTESTQSHARIYTADRLLEAVVRRSEQGLLTTSHATRYPPFTTHTYSPPAPDQRMRNKHRSLSRLDSLVLVAERNSSPLVESSHRKFPSNTKM